MTKQFKTVSILKMEAVRWPEISVSIYYLFTNLHGFKSQNTCTLINTGVIISRLAISSSFMFVSNEQWYREKLTEKIPCQSPVRSWGCLINVIYPQDFEEIIIRTL